MPERPIRVLFNTWANRSNVNSQSLSAREIARRLDPERFVSSLFLGWRQEADPRLLGRTNVRLLGVPPRFGSLEIARQLLWGAHDILFYPTLSPRASRLFWAFRRLGRGRKIVDCVETSLDQIEACPQPVQNAIFHSLRRADFRSAITPAIARDLADRYGLETEVIPLGVDRELFHAADHHDHEPPWRVLYVASIQPRKQTHLILELARRLGNEPVEFHCIGPVLGAESYYRQLVAEKSRDRLDRVFFRGAMEQRAISEELQRADVYILPSRLEGFAKTTLEAAACGLPTIVFADYETTAVVDGVTGFQVATLDEMEAALRRLLGDRELRRRMGQAAVEHARRFSWDTIARRWEQAFEELVSH